MLAIAPHWSIRTIPFAIKRRLVVQIRAGVIEANPQAGFRGNVIYYQGLGDSMLNHDPLFLALADAGFRVLAFDYPGQGRSTGSMNQTTVARINELGDVVWRELADLSGEPATQRMNIVGWSTGGLAAYRKACLAPEGVGKVVLIAPGIVLKWLVGEGLGSFPPNRISLETLTSAGHRGEDDPHVEPPWPDSPVKVPVFASCLLKESLKARRSWRASPAVQGYVALSDPADTYVDAGETLAVLGRNAPHFRTRVFAGALHEIDNEVPEIAGALRGEVVGFLGA